MVLLYRELERFRHPLILQNPEFSANPFETIQIHAKNTLLKHIP
jgi:ribosome biogenesis protein SLX9